MTRIVFDLDGTLVHSLPGIAASANALLAELGRPALPLATVEGFVGRGARVLVARMLEASGGEVRGGIEAAFARYLEIYLADPVSGSTPFPGVAETLAALARAGHGLAVCTQKPIAPTRRILTELRLMPPVTGITGGDSTGVLKPDPRMFHHAADQLPPGPAVMVGDSETDAATARAAGVPFLLHTRGYRRTSVAAIAPDAAFDDWRALPELVAELTQPA